MKKFMHTIFSTKKVDKIISAYDSLYPEEKEFVLEDISIKNRLLEINNLALITYLLIDQKQSIKKDYISHIEIESEHDKTLIDFLSSKENTLFPTDKLILLSDKTEKYLLFKLLQKYPQEMLKTIILNVDSQDIKDLSYILYEKKENRLQLSNNTINAVSPFVLERSLRRRKRKKKKTTLSFEEFMLIDEEKKNIILEASNIPSLEEQLSTLIEAGMHSEGVISEYISRINQRVNYLNTIYLRIAIKNSNNPQEQLNKLLKEYYGINTDIDPFYLDTLSELLLKPTIPTAEILNLLKQDPYVFFNYLLTNEEDHSLELLNKTTTIEQFIKEKRLNI